jgi:hypothetical protein
MEVVLGIYIASVVTAWLIGAAKGRAGAGFLLGLLLGVIGAIGALFLTATPASRGRTACPHCAEPILPAARLCPHCRSVLERTVVVPQSDGTF